MRKVIALAVIMAATACTGMSAGKTAYSADRTKSWTIVQNSRVQHPPIQEDGTQFTVEEK